MKKVLSYLMVKVNLEEHHAYPLSPSRARQIAPSTLVERLEQLSRRIAAGFIGIFKELRCYFAFFGNMF